MYINYWKLRERPFANLPDLRFAYMSAAFEEGLARLRYAVASDKGLAVLTGAVGAGKTFLLENLAAELADGGATVLKVVNPNLKPSEMLLRLYRALCASGTARFEGFDCANKTDLLSALRVYARQRVRIGRHVVVLVDDAQAIADDGTLEELRLLLNFCTEKKYLFQLVFAGLSRLLERLREFESLCQRVDVSFQLEAMAAQEIAPYIAHRLRVAGAGARAGGLFDAGAIDEVFRYSRGIPRLVNNVCDMALLVAGAERRERVDADCVLKAAEDRSVPASVCA